MNFKDKVVLITGSSSGIGRATAIQFAKLGAKVVVHYNQNQAGAEETLAQLEGMGHTSLRANAADPYDVEALIRVTVEKMGRLDILVNNAGIYEEHPIANVGYEEWQRSWRKVIDTNLIGVANMMYCAAQVMIPQGGGHIVNVSSRGAFRGEPTGPAYGASKGGLNSMSQSLAKALGQHNISVAVVAPGFVQTEMARESLQGEQGEFLRNESPFRRVATADEVAHAVLFLASDEATFSSGTILDVNGASYLRM